MMVTLTRWRRLAHTAADIGMRYDLLYFSDQNNILKAMDDRGLKNCLCWVVTIFYAQCHNASKLCHNDSAVIHDLKTKDVGPFCCLKQNKVNYYSGQNVKKNTLEYRV